MIVMNFDINENTINQSGYLRPEQNAAVFGLKTGFHPSRNQGKPKPEHSLSQKREGGIFI